MWRREQNAFGGSNEGLVTLKLCEIMSCSPMELNSRLTNLDEIILLAALEERNKLQEQAMRK